MLPLSHSPTLPLSHSPPLPLSLSPPLPYFPLPQSGESSGGSSIADRPPKLKTRNGGFDRT
ncbi:hypothetical protein [Microcoleus sp. B4-C1]|uniref:hypothetical protein n=1 Tax=Microcoleus sp. B4-C1 TaxID=2818660 RepID=UPI002FD198A0